MSGTIAAVLYHRSKFQFKMPEGSKVELQSRSVLCWSFDNNDADKGYLFKVPPQTYFDEDYSWDSQDLTHHKMFILIQSSELIYQTEFIQ